MSKRTHKGNTASNEPSGKKSKKNSSRESTQRPIISEIFLQDPRDGLYREFIFSDNGVMCSFCKDEVTVDIHNDHKEIIGNHRPNCKSFNLTCGTVSDIRGEIESFRVNNRTYERHAKKGSVIEYYCAECWEHEKITKANITYYATEKSRHCKECEKKQNGSQTESK